MKKIFVDQVRERDWVDELFLVRDKIMAMAKNGKPYMTLKLVDRSGEIEARVWDRVDEFSERFGKDDFLRVQGKASVYLGKMQLVIQELTPVPEHEVDLSDFLPVSKRSREDMLNELRGRIASLQDQNLRALLEAFFNDQALLNRYAAAPAAKSMHHVYIGGLLEHSLAVASLVDDICKRYPSLNRDLLLAGALLHDIGKVGELSYLRTFDYTDEGKLIGHIVLGVELVEDKIRTLVDFPRRTAILLKHMLLSHHGQYEYGSPKRPKTLEAVVLNFLDDLDSKINGVSAHIDKEIDNNANWTSYHRLYDRYFFKEGRSDKSEGPPQDVRPLIQPEPVPAQRNEGRENNSAHRSQPLGYTLAEQLKGKSLDLFASEEEEK